MTKGVRPRCFRCRQTDVPLNVVDIGQGGSVELCDRCDGERPAKGPLLRKWLRGVA